MSPLVLGRLESSRKCSGGRLDPLLLIKPPPRRVIQIAIKAFRIPL